MATYVKFEDFVNQLCQGVHDLDATGHTLNIYLSNITPDVAADTIKTDLAEIATGNGYTGPEDTAQTWAEVTGTGTLTGTKVVITAAGGAIAQFRYIVLYNDTPTTPLDPLIAYWDYGSALDLADGESLTIKFNNGDPTGTIFTIT
jgi:hypothetical protein